MAIEVQTLWAGVRQTGAVLLSLISLCLAQELIPYEQLIRVDVPDHPEALATSRKGSLLASPPSDSQFWREAPLPVTDQDLPQGVGDYVAWEALDAMDVQPWHDAGYTGQGVKVAVFDLGWYPLSDWADELGDVETHDCYAHDRCTTPLDDLRPRFDYEVNVHGIACSETIRDIAPDVELHLVRANGLTTFENAAAWAVREEIDFVSMSLSFFGNSFYDGTGPVSEVVQDLADGGVLLVTSSGNYATEHYDDGFVDRDGDGRHDMPDGSDLLWVQFGKGSRKVTLTWDNFNRCGDTDLDLFVYDSAGVLVGRSQNVQDREAARCSPVEKAKVEVTSSGLFGIAVERVGGVADVWFELYARGGDVVDGLPSFTIVDPAVHPMAFAVGAVRGVGYLDNSVESYSSQGPTRGGVPKPEIVGPDGLTTGVYGPTGFYGTSASTPAVVGALALIASRSPELTPREVAARAQAWAVGVQDPSWEAPDPVFGAGKLRLPDPGLLGGCFSGSATLVWLPLFWGRRRYRTAPSGGPVAAVGDPTGSGWAE
jgi:subtilisin family serine protease